MIKVDEAHIALEQAQTHWQAKEWQFTIQACAKALALDQKLAQAHKLMGDALQKTGQRDEAVGYYQQAIAIQPDFAKVYVNLGSLYANQKQWQKAIDSYQQALRVEPELLTVHQHLAKILVLQQQKSEVRIEQTNSIATVENYLRQGRTLKHAGKLEDALHQYRLAAKIAPHDVGVYREIVDVSERLGMWQEAAKYCRLILQLSGSAETAQAQQVARQATLPELSHPQLESDSQRLNAADYCELAINSIEDKNYKAAITYYHRAIEKQPDFIPAYFGWGELLNRLGLREQGISCYLQALKQIQDNPEIYYRLGNLYQLESKLSQAAVCYQKATQYAVNYAEAHHELAEVLSRKKQWSDAIASYRQAIKYNPDFSWSYNNLGYALIQIGQWRDAIPAYERAIALNPEFSWSYYNLAEACGMLHHWSKAVDLYRKVAEIQPDLPQLQQKLGNALYRRGYKDLDAALEHFLLAIEQEPHELLAYHQAIAIDKTNLELYLKLGNVLIEQGQLDEAIVTYQMALQVNPQNSTVTARLNEALQKKNPDVELKVFTSDSNNSAIKFNYTQAEIATLVGELQQTLPRSDSPVVSIIIPVYNQLNYTLRCLKAIASNLNQTISVEIILVNDCSTDNTRHVLEPISAITLANNEVNSGFIHACNHGASLAKGEYLYFLNNDTEIKPNCIESLLEVIVQPEVGAVGSKLIYPQGILQEAGGLVWQDGSAWNYGRQENPHAPEYNYLRPVDYCSGASLMVDKSAFMKLDGFAQELAPAYYEDTDLCFALHHKLGLKVMYQPKSEVIHYEGVSSGTSTVTGVKKYQVVNAEKFRRKWQHVLNNYPVNIGVRNTPTASRKYLGTKTVLIIDSYMPRYDRESGSRRLFEIIKIFKSLDFQVIFAADNGYKDEPYTSVLQDLQVEVLYTQQGYGVTIEQQIEQRLSLIDLAWICRPELNEKYFALVKQNNKIKVIYDTIDLHYLRLKREWELTSDRNEQSKNKWQDMQEKELLMAYQSDVAITVTSDEQEMLQYQLVNQVEVIPNVHLPYQGDLPGFDERSGLLFIGGYNHTPNVDGVKWLCREIMPLVWEKQPNLKVTLLGSNPSAEVQSLASDHVIVTGYIEDVTPYFLSHKLFVSPLRYGAGMKGKIGQSLEYKLPIISTKIGTEGMNLIPERDILEANSAEDFAEEILRLYSDARLWHKIAKSSTRAIAPYSPARIKQQLSTIINYLMID